MYTVMVTYYDSPREDCSGFYFDDYEITSAKEAWKFAHHINRQDEPKSAGVELSSGKSRRYSIFVNNFLYTKTNEYKEFKNKIEEIRRWKLKDGNTRKCINYRFEIV